MGKIRVKAFGDENLEKDQKNETKKRQETKKTTKAPGGKGGERVVAVGPSEEELEKLAEQEEKTEELNEEKLTPGKKGKSKKYFEEKDFHSQKYRTLSESYDKAQTFSLLEALKLLEKLQRKSFDESVELHINTLSIGVFGNVTLPFGTGKKTRVAIANDELIGEIEKGTINFDVLVSEPSMMPKLARVAKILGPRGLMPNPKNGTITEKPEEIAKKYEGGQISFKTEAKTPIIHATVGKVSFGEEKLSKNIETMITAIKKQNIRNITLKSTMSPGLKIKI